MSSTEENVISETNTIISSILEQIEIMLSPKFLFYPLATREVKQLRQYIKRINNLLKHLGAVGELDKRENVWLGWVRDICLPAKDFLTSFISKRELKIKRWAKLKAPTFLGADLELRKKMKVIRSRIQYAYGRRRIYGMAEPDEVERLQPSRAFELESIWRDLRLMCALIEDVQGMEEKGERVKIWLEQMGDLALEVDALNTQIQGHHQKMKGGLRGELRVLSSIAEKKEQISSKFQAMSERKSTYDIGKFEGNRCQISMPDIIVEDDNNNLEEAEPGSSQQEQHTNTGRCMGEIEEEVESIAPKSSLTNAMIGTRPSTSETVERSYTSDSKIRDIEQVESMERELKLIYAFLKDVEAIEEPDARLKFWEEEMRGIAQEAEVFLGPYKQNVRVEEKGFCNRLASTVKNLKADSKVVKRISKIRKKIQKFTERRIEYGIEHVEAFNSTSHKIYQKRPPSQYSEESDIIGFEDHEYEITERLRTVEPHRCIILVVGMEGSGKTNLAKSIYDKNKDHFCNCTHAWVPISGKCSAVEILQDIRKEVIGSDQEPKGKRYLEEELKQMLQTFFKGKRYLIVLDDIPTAGVWDDLKDTFPDESNRSRIVITTRDMAIASHSDSRIFQYKLHLRSIDESWTLFTDTLKNEVPKELEKLGKEIVMSCGGLPQTIVNKGKLLSEKAATIEEWLRVLNELKGETGPWLEISKKVSRELPLELKGCLYYFLLFPEDYEIPTRRLITLWVAEGFLRPGRGDKSPEHFAERYLMELIDRNLVQVTEKKPNGKVRTCCLPGALRKLLSKAMENKISKGLEKTASKSSSSIQWNRWIVDHHNYTDASNTSYNHIHGDNIDTATLQASYEKSLSFMSFDYREGSQPGEEIGNFLDRCISYRCFLLLRVLDLERVFRPQLPKVLRKLTLLRYLGLRWTYLESLPSSISNLLKLQTLDVKHTYISTLPPSIWKMQHLRHLYLSESYRSRFEPRPSGASLTDLQTLWGAFVDEKSPVNDGLDTLINLRKLGVACRCMSNQKDVMSSKLQAVANWIQKLEHLQSLRLKSHDENNQPCDLHIKTLFGHTNLSSVYFLGRLETPSIVSEFPENLIELTLSASALTEDPLQKLGKLPKLRILQLFSKSYVGKNMCCPQNSFPQLRVLKLWKLEELEDWIVKEGALSRLRDLEIRSCASLHKLPDGLQHVKTLQELKISNMPMEFTERTKDSNSEDWFKIEHVRYVRTEP
nr:disease resistance protein RPP13-like [Quercus suber]POF25080.1 putative disease resistance rpp8-like protein 2 [Quercus suber]